ncbi:MAG: hypothetical protein ACPGXL_06460 [Chitinophagales bacterium]
MNSEINFEKHNLPKPLLDLISFINALPSKNCFSKGFEFMINEEQLCSRSYSENPNFLNSIIEFGNADSSGSIYALWLNNITTLAPVIVFGSEGGCHVIATNTSEFLKILTLDIQPHIDFEGVFFYNHKNNAPSFYHKKYCNWLVENFPDLNDVSVLNIIENAQTVYQESFDKWMSKYYF